MAATKIIGIKALIELIFEKQGLENAQKDITKLQSNLNKVFKEVQNIQKGFRAKYGDTDSLIPDKELDKQATNALKSIGRVKKALVEMAGSLQAGGKLTGDQLTDLAAVIKKLKELEVIQENFKNTSAGTASELTKNFTIGPAAVQSVEVLQIAFNRLERDLVRTSKQIEQNKMGQGLPGAEGIKKDVGTIAGVLGSMTTTLENASREYNDLMTQVQKRSGDIKKAGSIELLPDAHAEKIQRNAREIIHDLELITASARGLAESAVFITRFKEQYAGISPSEALERVAAHTEAQANRIRTSLDLEINKQFMGGEFDASLQAVRGFATQASDLFDGMHRAVKKNAQGIKADTDSIGDEALEAAKKLSSIPEFKQIVDIGDLNKTRQGFQGLGNEISGLLDRWTQLQIKTKDKDIGALFKNSPAVRAEMKKLHLDLDILLNKMQELSTNPDKIQFLPPGAVSVLELVKRNLTDVAIKFNDIKNTKSGDLGALNFKALEGTLGALRLGWSNVSKEIGKTTGDTVAFTTAMEAATKQFNAGRIEAAIKPLRSISLNMLEIKKQAEAMGNTLPDVIRKLNSMTIAQREAFFTRPVNDGSEQAKLAIQAWEEEYKDLRAEVALVANGTEKLEGFFKRALTSAAQLGREGEESFKKLSKQYAALQQISNLLKGTATGEVFGATKAADISFFENLDKQFGKGSEITALAANIHKNVQQPLKELSRDAKVAEGEISNLNVRLAEMGTTANAPMEVIDRVEKLGSVAGTTNQTIITLRDNVQDAMTAPVSDSVTDEIKDMGESARTTQAAQENLVQSTRELGGAQQSLADDMAYIDMVMESLEQDYNQYADRAEQAENASRGFGEAVETTSRTIAESSGVIRVHEQNTDRMLEIMEKAAAFKGLQQRLEEDIRRIREEDRVIEALNEEFGKMTREQREIAQSGGAVENVMRSLGSQALNMTGDFRDAHAAMVKFSAELRQVRQEAAKPTRLTNLIDDKGWREAPGLIARAAVALDDYTLSARKAAAESRVLTLAQKSMEKEVHQQKSLGNKLISNVVEGVFHGIGYEAINVLQMGLYRLKDFVAQSNTIFKDFGKGLAEIYTIMPEASDAMRMQLADDVDFIAKTYGYLQGELLPAMYQALSLGVKPEGVTGTIETAARAARASVSELAPTLETGQALVNAYGGDLYSLDQIYDSLFFTIKNGSVTMRDLNANMSPITAVAGDVGVAFEDITAAITVMSRQGDSMGTISQMLSNMLTQIQLSETALGKAFTNAADMDFRTFIAQGGTLVEAMRLLQKHAEETGTTIAELTGGSSPFFRDQQSMLAVLELTGKHLEDLESATRGAYNAAGSMNAAYGEVDNTLFLLDQQSAATAESLQRDLGEAMQPMQRAWLEFKIAAVGAFQGIPIEIFKGNIQELNKELGYTREQLNEIYYLALYNDPDARSWVQKIFGTGDSKSALDVFEATFDDFSARMKSGEDITAVFAASFDEMWAHITAETKRGADEQAMAMRAVELAMMSGTMFSPEEIQQIIEKTLAVTAVQERYARAINDTAEARRKEAEANDIVAALTASQMPEAPPPLQVYSEEEQELWKQQTERRRNNFKENLDELQQQQIDVRNIMDGDTFEAVIDGKVTKIRLNNIDTAEIEHNGEGENMAWGQAGFRMTQDFLIEAGQIKIDPRGIDDFERTLGEVYNEAGESLELRIARAGLSIPVSVELAGDTDLYAQLQAATRGAAERGRGFFSNELVRAMFLEGSIDSTQQVAETYGRITTHFGRTLDFAEQMQEAYADMNDAGGEWVQGHKDNSARIAEIQAQLAGDLTKDQRSALDSQLKTMEGFSAEYEAIAQQIGADLTDNKRGDLMTELTALQAGQGAPVDVFTGDPEKLDEAKEKLKALREEIQGYYKDLAFNNFMEQEGGLTRPVLELGIALGIFDRVTGEYALQMANAATAVEILVNSSEFAALNVGMQAEAIKLLMGGIVITADEAIKRVKEVRAESELVNKAFETGYGTQIYYDFAEGKKPDFEDAPTTAQIDIDPTPFNNALETAGGQLLAFGETIATAQLAADPLDFNTDYGVIEELIKTYDEAKPELTFLTDHIEAEKVMDRLIEKAVDKTITYTYQIYTNGRIPQAEVEGGQASGGPVYPGTWLVGEMGPELVSINGYGNVMSNDQIRKAMGGGSGGQPIIVNIDARGVDKDNVHRVERAARDGIAIAMRRKGYN